MDRIGLPLPWGIVPTERLFRVVTGANPAVGAEVSVTVPGGVLWELLSFRVRFTASAAVGNRDVFLQWDDGNVTLGEVSYGEQIVAGGVHDVNVAAVGDRIPSAAGGSRLLPFPAGLPLLPGWRVLTRTVGQQAGDDYAAPVLYVAEYEIRGLDRARDRYLEVLARAGAEG